MPSKMPLVWIVSVAIHSFAVYALYRVAIRRYAKKVGSKGL